MILQSPATKCDEHTPFLNVSRLPHWQRGVDCTRLAQPPYSVLAQWESLCVWCCEMGCTVLGALLEPGRQGENSMSLFTASALTRMSCPPNLGAGKTENIGVVSKAHLEASLQQRNFFCSHFLFSFPLLLRITRNVLATTRRVLSEFKVLRIKFIGIVTASQCLEIPWQSGFCSREILNQWCANSSGAYYNNTHTLSPDNQ